MAINSLKSKATKGFIWNAIERFAITLGQFLIGIILARILSPEDFGLIGMLSVFIAISQVFIEGGLSTALIQKESRSKIDFSTVFVFNLIISLTLYFLVFIFSNDIAIFYEMPQLSILAKILGLNLLINAVTIIQRTKLEIEVDFKRIARINIVAISIGGVIAIFCAYSNFGVWSLVIYTLSVSIITAIGLWKLGDWDLSFKFSKESFKGLFKFGSKILIAVVYGRVLRESYNLIIGKTYSAGELGYYTQARKLTDIITNVIAGILQKVSFPILASIQNDRERLLQSFKKLIRMSAFITFPLMVSISIFSESLVVFLLTDKWIKIVPLVKWLSIMNMVIPVSVLNMNILNVIGRSDLFLKIDLLKLPIIIATFIITIPISLEAVVIGLFINSALSFFINTYYPGKFFGYGSISQIKDLSQIILCTFGMAITQYILNYILNGVFLNLIIGFSVGLIVYVGLSYIFRIKELNELYLLIKEWV